MQVLCLICIMGKALAPIFLFPESSFFSFLCGEVGYRDVFRCSVVRKLFLLEPMHVH